jgi:hypothetical protein
LFSRKRDSDGVLLTGIVPVHNLVHSSFVSRNKPLVITGFSSWVLFPSPAPLKKNLRII